MKKLSVSAIEDGSVIDHIPAARVFDVIKILGLAHIQSQITFGTNLDSKKLTKKGVIKVADRFFQPEEVNKIALFAPQATLIVIKGYQVVEKKTVKIPQSMSGFIKCVNPNCITNHEEVSSKFNVFFSEDELKLKCVYCEKDTMPENFQIIEQA